MNRFGYLLVFTLLCCASYADAATINAASCSQTAVGNAITAAVSGDTVVVPAGTCTWSYLVIPNTKGITLQGGQGGTTTIQGSEALDIQANASVSTRVTGFTFTGAGTVSRGDIWTSGTKASAPFRIDHNIFINGSSVFIVTYDNAPGLIDNNTITASGGSETIHNQGMGADDNSGWKDDVLPGSATMLFIEDNIFKSTDTLTIYSAVQSYYGARTVFRHNTVHFAQVDTHGSPGNIGIRWIEVYENTFMPDGLNQCCYAAIRAGTGVIFNNHVSGSNTGAGSFDLYEEDTGTWPTAYQVGSGINGLTDAHNTCASGTRNSSPAYLWGNDAIISIGSQFPSRVAKGRDYFVSATQPTSLFRQELSTDTCTTTYNYVPYTYPHPLRGGGSVKPAAPANLRVKI